MDLTLNPQASNRFLLLPLLIPGGLLLLLLGTGSARLEWPEYVRFSGLLAGLACLGWKRRSSLEPALLSALLILVMAQLFFPQQQSQLVCYLLWGILGLTLVCSVLFKPCRPTALSLLDWCVVGVTLVAVGLSTVVSRAFGLENHSFFSYQWVSFPVLWLLYRNWLPATGREQRWALGVISMSLAVVCLVGAFRIGSAYYHLYSGDHAAQGGSYEAALAQYESSTALSHALGFHGLLTQSQLGQARALLALGKKEHAAAVLGMNAGWKKGISGGEWEGPTGAHLYKNVSCWKDLLLCAGELEIRIHAEGQPAQGKWPRMQVKLGEKVLGEVEITSAEPKPYTFTTQVEPGEQRLEISLVNDFWELGGEDRWLVIGNAELQYKEIFP